MVNEVYVSPAFKELLEELCSTFVGTDFKSSVPKAKAEGYFNTIPEIPISRVTYSGDTTVVFFTDGTKTTVKCSSNDTYDRQTAIVYALVKRMFGKIGRYDSKTKKFYENEIDGNGLGTKLEKIADAGFDQDEEKWLKDRKAKAQEHVARQKMESEAAWKKKVEKRAKEIKLEREAAALADSLGNSKKVLNESIMNASEFFGGGEQKIVTAKPLEKKSEVQVEGDPKDAWKYYRKPNKPFSQFTSEEKREYWRYHNGKRRAEGKR